jgi:hypothetical protein
MAQQLFALCLLAIVLGSGSAQTITIPSFTVSYWNPTITSYEIVATVDAAYETAYITFGDAKPTQSFPPEAEAANYDYYPLVQEAVGYSNGFMIFDDSTEGGYYPAICWYPVSVSCL